MRVGPRVWSCLVALNVVDCVSEYCHALSFAVLSVLTRPCGAQPSRVVGFWVWHQTKHEAGWIAYSSDIAPTLIWGCWIW